MHVMSFIFFMMYAQPVRYMAAEILLVPILWAVLSVFTSKKRWLERTLNVLLLLISLWLILKSTVLGRVADARSGLVSLPFQLILTAIKENREIVRILLLNSLLFCPFGAALIGLLPGQGSAATRLLTVCMAGMVLSILIEWTQFHFSLGNAEADDVICNALGTLIGACALPIKDALERKDLRENT